MAFDVNIIARNIGPAQIYYGCTLPADRTPLALAAGGLPAGGTDFGATQGEAAWNYVPTIQGVDIEQVQGMVAPHMVSEALTLTFTMMERDYLRMAQALGQGTTLTSGGLNRVHLGGRQDVPSQCFALVAKSADEASYDVGVIYNGYVTPGAVVNKRGEARGVQVTVTALALSGRVVGDQLGQFLDDYVV